MLPTVLRSLEPLSSSQAPQLVVALVVSGALVLTALSSRLGVVAFLVQRSIVAVLLWPAIGAPLAVVNIMSAVACVILLFGTELGLRRAGRQHLDAVTHWPGPTSLALRALAAALAALISYGFVQTLALGTLPPIAAFTVTLLVANGLIALGLASTALHTGIGILALADGFRVLCAFFRLNLLAWGMWSVCDVLVALAACSLGRAEVATTAGPTRECQ